MFYQSKKFINETLLRNHITRFLYFFCLYFLIRYFLFFFESCNFGKELLYPMYERMSFFITNTSCYVLKYFYPDIHSSQNHTIIINNKTPIQLLPGCTGVSQLIRMSIILLIYPISLMKKCLLFLPTILVIIFGTTVHFLILIPIAYKRPELYELAHNYLTKIVFLALIFFCWWLWEKFKSR